MAVIVDGNVIVLTGTVGDLYWDDGFSAADVIAALAQVGRDTDITVRINSGGGVATEGSAIYSALATHKGRKTVVVEGIAASAASVIAMAGDEVVMSMGAIMMIHDPSGFTFGTVVDHEKQIEALTALATAMAGIYADKTGRSAEECRADMVAETWMTPEQAVEKGYADRVRGKGANDNAPAEPTAFNYRLYSNAPEPLVALADARAWTSRARPLAASPAATRQPKETEMTDKQTAGTGPANDKTHTAAEVAAATQAAQVTATAAANAAAAEIVTLCANAGVPTMAAALIKDGVTVEQAKARVDGAKDIRAAVELARKSCPAIEAGLADTFVAAGTSLQAVREDLFQRMTAAQAAADVQSQHQAGTGAATEASEAEALAAQIVATVRPNTKKGSA